ncbi:MAG: hypothetical protein ACREOU_08735 [Candidatus Eiseniibacteriota bacterium]
MSTRIQEKLTQAAALVVLLAVALAAALGAALLDSRPAAAQAYDARSLAMGGIVVSDVTGSSALNVAYRAVPRYSGALGYNVIPLPLGVIQTLANPPEFDSSNPNFNVFEIANMVAISPTTIQLIEPEPISDDVIVDIGQDALAIDLGSLQSLFPNDDIKYGLVMNGPNLEFGTSNVFFGVHPQVEAKNSLALDEALQGALGEGEPFVPNTSYGAADDARAQAAFAITAGGALPVMPPRDAPDGDPRRGGKAVYVGARVKYLRGIALWQATSAGQFTTGDTILGPSTPLRFDYVSEVRQTQDPGFDAGQGFGVDAGVAFFVNKFEIGLGVRDIGTQIRWSNTKLDRYTYDPNTNSNVQTRLETGTDYVVKFPVTGAFNLTWRNEGLTVGGTLERTTNERWIPRAGAEAWFGPAPVRGGLVLDTYRLLQVSAGTGLRLGRIGLDVALATHSRGLTRARGLEMGASIALY